MAAALWCVSDVAFWGVRPANKAGAGNGAGALLFQRENMKTKLPAVMLVSALALLIGCASPRRGPAYGHQQEFRRQLAESIPVKEYGYTIKDLMFSDDYRKALVIFTHTDNQAGLDNRQRRPDWEFTLESDGFRRYKGMQMQPFYTLGTASTPPVYVTVIVPEK